MRKCFLHLIVLLFATTAKAQYVNIPDSNFRNFLMVKYPACFNASKQMDTTCSAMPTVTYLVLHNVFLENMEGIQYFKSINKLDIIDCPIVDSIPKFPLSLRRLYVGGSGGNSAFPKLPQTVTSIFLDRCGFTRFTNLPDSLISLEMEHCYYLKKLPQIPSKLEKLICYDAIFDSIPTLPNTLKIFSTFNTGQLQYLPALPISLTSLNINLALLVPNLYNLLMPLSNLTYLNCSSCNLDSLPPLSIYLKELDCSNNSLSRLPVLPNELEKLECTGNLIKNLQSLPDSLIILKCSGNLLKSVPNLPSKLTELNCSYNKLGQLPILPNSLNYLNCSFDSLVSFPSNLPPNISEVDCSHNLLTNLGVSKLNFYNKLNCSYNKLTHLPEIEALNRIDCSFNPNLKCLPTLPNNLYGLFINGTGITCLPNAGNYGVNSDFWQSDYGGYPFCNPSNNINQCQSYPNISGNIYNDINKNGVQNSNELVRSKVKVSLSNGTSVFTDDNGNYNTTANSLGTLTVTANAPRLYAASPLVYNHNFTRYDTLVNDTFALQPNVVKDSLTLTITPINWRARPGFSFPYSISYENVGTTTVNPTFNFNYDSSKLIYDSSSASVTNTGNSLSLNVGNIVPGYSNSIVAYFRVKTTVPIGDSIISNASLTVSSITVTTKDVAQVSGAFDPNDKQATPELSKQQVTEGKRIDYTIRFQNTGNDTAFHVVITDTLDSKLNFNSLQMIATSHLCKTTIKDNIIFFEMRDIMLPDSNVDKLGSNGFIRFTMQPKSTVVAGNNIPNKAAIYFDYNAPVITNTAITQIKSPILPVKFMSYILRQAQDDKNRIENIWQTSNEINTSHFIVQRSEDGRVYKSVGKVAAKGFGTYEFIDLIPTSNSPFTIYYRLQAVDKDGSYQFSEVRQIRLNELTNKQINIFPNPSTSIVTIDCKDAKEISIIDYLGKTIKQFNNITEHQTINTHQFLKGIYMVKMVMNNGEIKTEKLVVE